ncbi:MAG TPA: amidohydrolase family protein [Candidatus Binataceae bacterium]|nr:amidohydrolase family protein [Candidatus Binataceae bacterium]
MAGEYKLVDAFVGLPTPPKKAARERPMDPNIQKWFRPNRAFAEGATIEDVITEMDTAEVEKGVLTAGALRLERSPYNVGQHISDDTFETLCRRTAQACADYPGRFHACIQVDPTGMMKAVRRLERAVKEFGFRSAWIMPSMVGLPPNHACYFPIYAKCVELGIPIKINVGVPGPMRPGLMQHPMALDEVLLAFPELTVVGCHLGHPWHVEMVALLQKHANFFLITSAWAPKHIPAELWHLANTRGRDKLMWASDFPLLTMQRCAKEGWEAPLKEEARRGYLRDNALRVFKFE